jgi:hypothetical protein
MGHMAWWPIETGNSRTGLSTAFLAADAFWGEELGMFLAFRQVI